MDSTTQSATLEAFVQTMTERMANLARTLGTWVQAEERTLQQQEQQLLRQLHELGTTLLSGLLALAAASPPPSVTCPCGASATFQRLRPATVTTLLGRLTYSRATYSCASCKSGHAPLDQQLQVAAGSFSLGLQELLALLGATQDSFAQAATVLQRLCLVQVCPNSVRAATQEVGALLVDHTHKAVRAVQEQAEMPSPQTCVPSRLYISMDGVVVHCRRTGWRELKTGCIYTTRSQRSRRAPQAQVLRMEQPSYTASLAEAAPFGNQLCVEALRRGVEVADEVIVIADGAHWIWKVAEEHFPQATQIVDWYHASQYLWQAASAVHGEGTPARERWAKQHLEALWEGRVDAVLAALQPSAGDGGAVDAAISYYRTQRARMDYPSYRARGLQIGSGTIESTCKHLVSARLKQAGMIWSERGAEAVVAVRAWLKSERWAEAMALRPIPRRRAKQQALPLPTEAVPMSEDDDKLALPVAPALPAEVCERVRAELAAEAARHPWRCAWSRRQQCRQAAVRRESVQTRLLA
jgi:Uncharacterised protein family (UPF0236)